MPEPNELVSILDNDNIIPEWMNKDYIESALQDYKNDKSVKLTKLEIIPLTKKGENYLSIIVKIRAAYKSESQNEPEHGNFLLKLSFEEDEIVNNVFGQYEGYKREMEVYYNIFPKLKKILTTMKYTDKLAPETTKIDFPKNSILFEDLSASNYIMADRLKGLDMSHSKLILKKLAKMHAASVILNETNPGIFKDYDRGIFNRHTEAFSGLFADSFEVFGQMVSEWEGFEEYGKKLIKLKPYVMEYGARVYDVKDNIFCVLTHGDLWTNNALFKYDDSGEPIDVIMIDFQFSSWGSPAIDLHYFFNTSLKDELRLNRQDELIHYYYEQLTNTLSALNFKGKIPSLKEFWLQIMERSFFGVISAFVSQAMMINDKTEDADFAALMGSDERGIRFKQTVYSNEKVQNNFKILLPIFNRRGLLDVD